MHIYIDESGGFIPLDGRQSRVSTLAALIIPSRQRERLADEFLNFRTRVRPGATELRGRELDEDEIASALRLMAKYESIVELCAIDIGQHNDSDVTAFKHLQAEKIIDGLPSNASEWLRVDVKDLADRARSLSNQLFVQAWMMILLVQRAVDTSINYHSQRHPRELEEFCWSIDAKNDRLAPGEEFWTKLIFPVVQALTSEKPFGLIPWGDFSSYDRFLIPADKLARVPIPGHLQTGTRVTDFGAVMTENFAFRNSAEDIGLQMVDIVANAFARALNQRLAEPGWIGLGKLLVNRGRNTIQFVRLRKHPDEPNVVRVRNFHGYVNETLQAEAKSMVPQRYRHLLSTNDEYIREYVATRNRRSGVEYTG